MRRQPFELDRASPPRRSGKGVNWRDEARFIRTWLEHPRSTGAVSPSSRSLSRMIARQVDPAVPGPIVELGPGTGPVTDALIRRGVDPSRLVLVEYEAAFCTLLSRRYPHCTIVQGDAYALRRTLGGRLPAPAAAVVSSLPLLNRREAQRLMLLEEAFDLMAAGAPFVQFTYGLVSPMPKGHPFGPSFRAQASAPVLLNLPPARVWTYRRLEADEREPPDFIDRLKLSGEKLGEEWREQRERLRAEWRMRAQKVKTGLARRDDRKAGEGRRRAEASFDRQQPW